VRPRYIPYTLKGIKRVPCARCGKPSTQQWRVCADFNQYRGVCTDCDIEINAMVLNFMRVPDVEKKLVAYRQRLRKLAA